MISGNETIQINFLMHTHGGHDGDGEQERLGEGPPHVPAVDGAVILVITSGVHDKGDQRSQVRVAFVLKPICFIIFMSQSRPTFIYYAFTVWPSQIYKTCINNVT